MVQGLQTPPGFGVRTTLEKAAWDSGYRHDRRREGAWISVASTTARGRVWMAGEDDHGPWWLATDHPGVAAEFGPGADIASPGLAAWRFSDLADLYKALDRVYRLGVSLPDAPLDEFKRQTAGMPRATEAERLVVQRVGQDVFRAALVDYWDGACAVTGLVDNDLLRASHIVPWRDCETDAERLDVHNGLLLSALWDAVFDAGLVTFDETGQAIFSAALSSDARHALGPIVGLRRPPSPEQAAYLARHARDVFKTPASI